MKKRNKFVAMLMTACLTAALLGGCGSSGQTESAAENTEASSTTAAEASSAAETEAASGTEEAAPAVDTSEHVVLTMYCIGDEGGIYAEEHLNKLNEVLTEKINAEIDPIMVSWGDYKTKLPMVWASGEAYDLTYTSNWTNYFLEAGRGAFMDITELFPQYAPLTYAEFTEKDLLETTKVDGKLYMVPNDLPDYTTFMYNYREDLRKKYNCPEIVDEETLETYLQAIKDNEPGMIPLSNNASETMFNATWLNEMDWSRSIDSAGLFIYDLNDPSKVFSMVDTPEYEEYVKKCRDFYEKGYWSQSVMAETTAAKDNFVAGKSAIYLANMSNSNGVYQELSSSHPDWEIGIYSSDLASGMTERIAATNNGMAVGAYSEHPERALMFLELCNQDEEVYDLLMYGLEGVTYEADKEARTKWTPEGADPTELTLKNIGMGMGNEKFYLNNTNDSPLVNELKEEYDAVGVFPGLAGFALDQDPIAAELAALKSVSDEYRIPLEKGVVDPETGLEELRQKLKDAGADKVLEEINRQVTEYLAQQ